MVSVVFSANQKRLHLHHKSQPIRGRVNRFGSISSEKERNFRVSANHCNLHRFTSSVSNLATNIVKRNVKILFCNIRPCCEDFILQH